MANTTYLTKISGVLNITQTTGRGNYYAATAVANGKYKANSAGDTIYISVGGDEYQVKLTDLRVNSQTPANLGVAFVLLNSIFGT